MIKGAIRVTGAVRQPGGAVAQALLAKGRKLRAPPRNPDQAGMRKRAGAEVVQGDLIERRELRSVLQGTHCVLVIPTPMAARRTIGWARA